VVNRGSLSLSSGAKVRGGWRIILKCLLPGGGRGWAVCCEKGPRRRGSIGLEVGCPACCGGNCRGQLRQGGSTLEVFPEMVACWMCVPLTSSAALAKARF